MDEIFILKKEMGSEALDYYFPYDDLVSVKELVKKIDELYDDIKRMQDDDSEDRYEDIRLKEMEIYEENNR